MDHHLEVQVIERILALLASRSTDMAPAPSSLPVGPYIDGPLLERERAVLFGGLPLVVAHPSQLAAPGDFVTHDASGAPLLLVRDGAGALRGFLNVCRHRGTRLLAEPSGHRRKAFTCPYHGWTYTTDGALLHVPHDEGFPGIACEEVRLAQVPAAERLGLVFAVPRPGAAVDIAGHLAPLEADLRALGLGEHVLYRTESFTRDLNWKIAIEIFLEGYHVKYAHKDSIYPLFFDNVSLSESLHPHYRGVFPKRTIAELGGADRAGWRLRPHANLLYHVFPNTLILVQPDHVSLLQVFPEGTDRTLLVAVTLIPTAPKSDKERHYWDRNIDILLSAVKEDLALGESIQRGIRSGANATFRLGRYEHGIRYFHDALAAALTQQASG